jgi:hypothetical protein
MAIPIRDVRLRCGASRIGKIVLQILVKGVWRAKSPQVIAMMGNIKFEKFPVYPTRFDMLDL